MERRLDMTLRVMRCISVLGTAMLAFLATGNVFGQQDADGCKDYPLLSRMPDHYIYSCETTDWNAVPFVNEKGENITIQGKVYNLEYSLNEGAKEPSPLQIIRNYENAIEKIGGRVVFDQDPDRNKAWLEVEKNGKKIDVYVLGDWGGYSLTIIERQAMNQEVVADPETLARDISSKGHASVYGIYFDVDSDVIKPESKPTLKAIAELWRSNPNLRVYVVGHTDMTGSLEHNMVLSLKRARSVVRALEREYGISAEHLIARGVGPLAPVASNRAEDGRQLNRRVELVEIP